MKNKKIKIMYLYSGTLPSKITNRLQVMKMCESFSKKAEIILVVFNKQKKDRDVFKYYDIKQKFKIIENNKGHKSFFGSFLYVFYLIKKIKKIKPNIIYTRERGITFWISLLKRLKIINSFLIYEIHEIPPFKFKRLIEKIIKVDKTITITKYLQKYYNADFVLPDAVELNRFDIKITKSDARIKLKLDQKIKIIGYVGHLYKWKGVFILADASKYIKGKQLMIGGNEKDIQYMKKYINEKKLNNVELVGYLNQDKIPLYLKACDVLVLPNSGKDKISRYYTSPLKLFEYMASKRPIVASNLPSIRDILNESNAIFVEPDNPKKMAEGINIVLSDKKLSKKIVENAFCDVKKYTWDLRADRVLKIYEEDIN